MHYKSQFITRKQLYGMHKNSETRYCFANGITRSKMMSVITVWSTPNDRFSVVLIFARRFTTFANTIYLLIISCQITLTHSRTHTHTHTRARARARAQTNKPARTHARTHIITTIFVIAKCTLFTVYNTHFRWYPFCSFFLWTYILILPLTH